MPTKTTSKTLLWIGRVMSALVILFMLMDALGKLTRQPVAVKTTVDELGYGEHHLLALGVLALAATLLYALPRTAVVGAIVFTGYWGGAMAAQLRVDAPLWSHTLFPLYLAALAWGGLLLREPLIRARLFPKPVREQPRTANTVVLTIGQEPYHPKNL